VHGGAVAHLVDVAGADDAEDALLVGVLALHEPRGLLLQAEVDEDGAVGVGGDLVTDLLAELVRLLELGQLLVAGLDADGGLAEGGLGLGLGEGDELVQLVERVGLEEDGVAIEDVAELQLLVRRGRDRHLALAAGAGCHGGFLRFLHAGAERPLAAGFLGREDRSSRLL
jgi:hypothetical protein